MQFTWVHASLQQVLEILTRTGSEWIVTEGLRQRYSYSYCRLFGQPGGTPVINPSWLGVLTLVGSRITI